MSHTEITVPVTMTRHQWRAWADDHAEAMMEGDGVSPALPLDGQQADAVFMASYPLVDPLDGLVSDAS